MLKKVPASYFAVEKDNHKTKIVNIFEHQMIPNNVKQF